MSVTLFFSSASPGRDAYAVVFLTVNSADRTRWPHWTTGWDSSGFHNNRSEGSRDFPRLLPSKGKLCAQLSCEAPQSHCCSQALKVHRNSPEGACDHLPGTLKVFLHSFYSVAFPYPCQPISQPGWILSLIGAADTLLYSPFSHIYQKQRAEQREFLSLCSCPAWTMKKKSHIKELSHCFNWQPGLTSVDKCLSASVGDLGGRWKPPNLFLLSVAKIVLKVKQWNNVGFSGMANRFIKEVVHVFKYMLYI